MSISLSTLYTRLRNAIGDEGETGVDQEYTDADLANYLAQAVTRYSAHVPHVLVQTQTTVADQSDYALPSNATGVRQVKWRYTTYVFPASLTPTFNAEFRDDALLMVRDQIIANFDRQTLTSWAVQEPQLVTSVMLKPRQRIRHALRVLFRGRARIDTGELE